MMQLLAAGKHRLSVWAIQIEIESSASRPRRALLFAAAVLAALATTLIYTHPAVAGGFSNPISNGSDIVKSAAISLFGAVVAIIAIALLIKREIKAFCLFLLAAFVAGWAVVDPSGISQAGSGIAKKIFGG